MASTSKPIRSEIKKDESHNRKRIKKAEKMNEITPKEGRKIANKLHEKSYGGKKILKQATKENTMQTMQNRKDTGNMRKRKLSK